MRGAAATEGDSPHLRRRTVLLLALAILAPACSQSDDSTGTPSRTDAATTETQTPPPPTTETQTPPPPTTETQAAPPAPVTEPANWSSHGVSFRYPSDWRTLSRSGAAQGNVLWSDVIGLDGVNAVTLTAFALKTSVDPSNVASLRSAAERALDDFAQKLDAEVTRRPTRVQAGRLPGFEASSDGTVQGDPVKRRAILLYRNKTMYFLVCQQGSDAAAARSIERGCDQMLRTLRVRTPAVGTTTFRSRGVSFRYPSDWRSLNRSGAAQGNVLWSQVIGLDGLNAVTLTAFRTKTSVNPGNVANARRSAARALDDFAQKLDAEVTRRPTRVRGGQLPGFEARSVGRLQGDAVQRRAILLYRNTTMYFLVCQQGSRGPKARAIERGCNQILRSFVAR